LISGDTSVERGHVRVLFLNSNKSPVYGGVERWMMDAAEGLVARGHACVMLGRPGAPWVDAARRSEMSAAANDPQVVAYVWDTPLLFEAGLATQCDAVVFVDAPIEQRVRRVRETRGWDEAELLRRQKSQWPLDKKRRISDYVVTNTADADYARGQVREVLSRILARSSNRPE